MTELTYPGVYIEELPSDAHPIPGVDTSTTAFLGRTSDGPIEEPILVSSFQEFESIFGGLALSYPLTYSVSHFYVNGGIRAVIVRLAGDTEPCLTPAAYAGSRQLKTGMFALERTELFNLLCIPPDTRHSDTPPEVYRAAMAYCMERRALLIVDPPAGWSANPTTAAATASTSLPTLNLSGEAARNAAIYFPRVVALDPLLGNQPDTFAPSGFIAGVMARGDKEHGVWKAAAGTEACLIGAKGLDAHLSDTDTGLLNPMRINCLREFPTSGPVVWGARTLIGANEGEDGSRYVPVRRLALYLEESIDRGTQWTIFEANDESLWARLRVSITAFMHGLFTQGAFQGAKPDEAYFVKSDGTTTTPDDITQGYVNILVGFAPVKPAEFIIFKIRQATNQP